MDGGIKRAQADQAPVCVREKGGDLVCGEGGMMWDQGRQGPGSISEARSVAVSRRKEWLSSWLSPPCLSVCLCPRPPAPPPAAAAHACCGGGGVDGGVVGLQGLPKPSHTSLPPLLWHD